MEHELDEEFFVLAVDFVEIELTIDISDCLDLTELAEVLGHVRGQDSLDDDMAASLEVLVRHVDCPIAGFILCHECKCCRQMMVLQHTDIVVSHGNLVIHVDQKDVVDAGRLEVVQCS